jgi:hypothetical protein
MSSPDTIFTRGYDLAGQVPGDPTALPKEPVHPQSHPQPLGVGLEVQVAGGGRHRVRDEGVDQAYGRLRARSGHEVLRFVVRRHDLVGVLGWR